jgi:hypothetical protein
MILGFEGEGDRQASILFMAYNPPDFKTDWPLPDKLLSIIAQNRR